MKRVQVEMVKRYEALFPGRRYNLPDDLVKFLVSKGVAVLVIANTREYEAGPSEFKSPTEIKGPSGDREQRDKPKPFFEEHIPQAQTVAGAPRPLFKKPHTPKSDDKK